MAGALVGTVGTVAFVPPAEGRYAHAHGVAVSGAQVAAQGVAAERGADSVREAAAEVAELRRAAERARATLSEASARLRAAEQRVEISRARLRAYESRAERAGKEAAAGRRELGELAAAMYKSPGSSFPVLGGENMREFLHTATATSQVARTSGIRVQRIIGRQQQARALAAGAKEVASDLQRQESKLAQRRSELAERAALIGRRLSRALERLEAQRRKQAAAALPGVPGCRPRPGYKDYPNGMIPEDALCPLPQQGEQLRADAARTFYPLNDAYKRAFGEPICVTDSYRSYEEQQQLYAAKPGLAAEPGTSNHGYGTAVDLCGGAESYDTAQYQWLDANGDRYGWDNPSWAREGQGREEPWHWESNSS